MQLKKILSSILVVILIITAAAFTVSAEEVAENNFEFAVEINNSTVDSEGFVVDADDVLDVSLTITNNPGVKRLSIVLEYDADVFTLVTKDDEVVYETAIFDFYDDEFERDTIDFSVPGKIKITSDLWNQTKVEGTGEFLTFSFEVAEGFHGDREIKVKSANTALDVKTVGKSAKVCAHAFADAKTVAADCLNDGYTERACTACDYVLVTDVKKATGHTVEVIPAVAPTADKAGSTAGEKCSVCGTILKAPEVVPATGTPAGNDEPTSLVWLWVVLAVAVVAGAGVAVYFFVIKKKK